MLKSSIIVLTFLAIQLAHTHQRYTPEAFRLCRAQEEVTDQDLNNWKHSIVPNLRMLKCYEACLAEQMEMFINNKLNVGQWMANVDKLYKDKETRRIYQKIVNECALITDEDRCDMIEKVLDCLRDLPRKHSLEELID